ALRLVDGRVKAVAVAASGRRQATALRKDVARLSSGRVAAAVLSAICLVIAARDLSVPNFADLALVLAVGLIVSAVSDFGYPLVLLDVVSRDRMTAQSALRLAISRRLVLVAASAGPFLLAYLAGAHRFDPLVPALFL